MGESEVREVIPNFRGYKGDPREGVPIVFNTPTKDLLKREDCTKWGVTAKKKLGQIHATIR